MTFLDGQTQICAATTRILRADNGTEVSCEELFRVGRQPTVWIFDERRRLVAQPVTSIVPDGCRDVFTVRLASGRELDAAIGSEFMMLHGTKRLEELSPGDRIAVPRRAPEPLSIKTMADEEVVLLAHMIGDGSCVKNQPIRYASIDEQNLFAVANAARYFGVTAIRDDYPAARVTTLRLPAPYRLTHGRRNPIAAWLDDHGLFGKRSYEKFVPVAVFATSNDQVALFLRHLWATDGCVAWDEKQDMGRIYYSSTSRQLIGDVRHLLLRIGISSRSYRIKKSGYRDGWHLVIHGANNQRRFSSQIDVHGEKFFAVRQLLTNLKAVSSNENVDTVPSEVWDQVRRAPREQGLTHRAFAAAMHTKFCGSTMWKHSPSRSRLHRASTIIEDRSIHDLATNDVFWDKIVSINGVGVQDVYRVSTASSETDR